MGTADGRYWAGLAARIIDLAKKSDEGVAAPSDLCQCQLCQITRADDPDSRGLTGHMKPHICSICSRAEPGDHALECQLYGPVGMGTWKAAPGELEERPARDPNPKKAFGDAKPPLGLVPSGGMIRVAEAMAEGNAKYGPANWRVDPVEDMTYIHAALRHIQQYKDGETIDPTSGAHHLGHAASCLLIVLDAEICGTLIDTRPPAGKTGEAIREFAKRSTLHHYVPATEIETAFSLKGLIAIPATLWLFAEARHGAGLAWALTHPPEIYRHG